MLREAASSAVRFHASNSQNADLYIGVNVKLQQFQQLHFVTLVRDIPFLHWGEPQMDPP